MLNTSFRLHRSVLWDEGPADTASPVLQQIQGSLAMPAWAPVTRFADLLPPAATKKEGIYVEGTITAKNIAISATCDECGRLTAAGNTTW